MIRDHQVVIVGGPKQDGGWPPFKKKREIAISALQLFDRFWSNLAWGPTAHRMLKFTLFGNSRWRTPP